MYPKSCWSSPYIGDNNGVAPSCKRRRYIFLATKLNL